MCVCVFTSMMKDDIIHQYAILAPRVWRRAGQTVTRAPSMAARRTVSEETYHKAILHALMTFVHTQRHILS